MTSCNNGRQRSFHGSDGSNFQSASIFAGQFYAPLLLTSSKNCCNNLWPASRRVLLFRFCMPFATLRMNVLLPVCCMSVFQEYTFLYQAISCRSFVSMNAPAQ